MITYFENLIIELYVFYVLKTRVKFHVNQILFTICEGPIDPICSNCIGKGWTQYPVSYVQTV